MNRWLLASLAPLALIAAAPDGARWWSYVEFLASDKLEGRNTGSPAHKRAAEYVAAQFEKAGLEPAGVGGFIQPVAFKTRRILEAHLGTLDLKSEPGKGTTARARVPLAEAEKRAS